jgi:hypothetical protein
VQFDRACRLQTYVWRRSKAGKPYIGIFAGLFDSGFDQSSALDR